MKKFVLVLLLFLVGCSDSESVTPEYADVVVENIVYVEVIKEVNVESGDQSVSDYSSGGDNVVNLAGVPALENRKIIYMADLRVDSFDLDEYHSLVNNQVIIHGGYYQSEYATEKRLNLTVRVPSEALDDFLNALKGGGEVTYFRKTSQDITNTYTTYEARKFALEAQHLRLIELITVAETIEDIIELESARADIESELTEIGITLTSYDSLVDFSTVTVEVDLKDPETYDLLPMARQTHISLTDTGKDYLEFDLYNASEVTMIADISIYEKDELILNFQTKVYSLMHEIVKVEELDSDTVYKFEIFSAQEEHEDSNVEIKTYQTIENYGDKVSNTFLNTVDGMSSFIVGLSLFLLGSIPYLIILGVLFIPGRYVYKRIKSNAVKIKNNENDS